MECTPTKKMKEKHIDEYNIDLLTRRELQYVAKQLNICKANVKSDIIIEYLNDYAKLNYPNNKKQIIQIVHDMPDELRFRTPLKSSSKIQITPMSLRGGRIYGSNIKDKEKSISISSDIHRTLEFTNNNEEISINVKKEDKMDDNHSINKENENVFKSVDNTITNVPIYQEEENTNENIKDNDCIIKTSSKLNNNTILSTKDERNIINNQNRNEITSKISTIPNKYSNNGITNELYEFVTKEKTLTFIDKDINNIRVRCLLTDHEMKACKTSILKYLNGKNYLKLLKEEKEKQFFQDFQPMFIDYVDTNLMNENDKKYTKLLYCTVTNTFLPKEKKHVLNHFNGITYQNSFLQWKDNYLKNKYNKNMNDLNRNDYTKGLEKVNIIYK